MIGQTFYHIQVDPSDLLTLVYPAHGFLLVRGETLVSHHHAVAIHYVKVALRQHPR